ncbi:MAG: 2Fe-2S iron-sulfur cluster-binding protein [Fimbriimonas sp.]
MAKHTIRPEGFAPFETEEGTKLVLALEENGVDVSHRCGGQARCTTCRVEILSSEEPAMGDKEKECLVEDGVLGQFRLSCQIRVDRDLDVRVLRRASVEGWEPGPTPEP